MSEEKKCFLIEKDTFNMIEGTPKSYFDTHVHSADDITSGILPIARGGTGVNGATAADGLLTALQLYKVQSGTYVGTGTYGTGNKNSLIFDFVPKIIFITSINTSDQMIYYRQQSQTNVLLFDESNAYIRTIETNLNNKTLTWVYSGSVFALTSRAQLNELGSTYLYIAIG